MLMLASIIFLARLNRYLKVVCYRRNGAIEPIAKRTPRIVTLVEIKYQNAIVNVALLEIEVTPTAIRRFAIGQILEWQEKMVAVG